MNRPLPCPKCNAEQSITGGPKLQTPAEDDDLIRRYYVRCFTCGHMGPVETFSRAMSIESVGRGTRYADLILPWNLEAAKAMTKESDQ